MHCIARVFERRFLSADIYASVDSEAQGAAKIGLRREDSGADQQGENDIKQRFH